MNPDIPETIQTHAAQKAAGIRYPRGICRVCGSRVGLTVGNRMNEHKSMRVRCAGSGVLSANLAE